jgi:hypothetical protein
MVGLTPLHVQIGHDGFDGYGRLSMSTDGPDRLK